MVLEVVTLQTSELGHTMYHGASHLITVIDKTRIVFNLTAYSCTVAVLASLKYVTFHGGDLQQEQVGRMQLGV